MGQKQIRDTKEKENKELACVHEKGFGYMTAYYLVVGGMDHMDTHTPTEHYEEEETRERQRKKQSQKKAEDDVCMCIVTHFTKKQSQKNQKEAMVMPLDGDRWIYIYNIYG